MFVPWNQEEAANEIMHQARDDCNQGSRQEGGHRSEQVEDREGPEESDGTDCADERDGPVSRHAVETVSYCNSVNVTN